TRDFLYIEDAAQAFLAAGAVAKPMGEKYVVGSEKGDTFTNIVELISNLASKSGLAAPEVVIDTQTAIKPVEMRNFVANSSKFKELTGWQAQTSFETGIERTIDYFKNHATRTT